MNAEILGHLLVMQAVLVNLPTSLSIFQFVRKGLETFPGITSLRILPLQEGLEIPPETPGRAVVSDAGYSGYCLVAELEPRPAGSKEAGDNYEPYLRNFLNMVQIILEEKNQKRLLQEQNTTLTETIEAKNRLQRELVVQEKIAGLLPLSTIIAHGMNTPLGNIITLGSNVLDRSRDVAKQLETGLTQRQFTAYLDNIQDSLSGLLIDARRATKLVERFQNVLNSSQNVSAKTRFNLHSLVLHTIESLSAQENCDALDFEICLTEDLWVTSYPTAIGRVLAIFLENVIHHAYPNLRRLHAETSEPLSGLVTVSGGVNSQEGLTLGVQDFGIGIASDRLENIFDPFVTTALQRGHNGLGLSIAHYIATEHLLGRVEAESLPDPVSPSGHRTRFSLMIPPRSLL